MGQPARKIDHRKAKRPHLNLVPTPTTPSVPRNARAQALAAQRNFKMFALLTVIVALLGVTRVWLAVEATEVSRESERLRETIRSERYNGDMLEMRQSALSSPSRIRTVATKTMGMAPAKSVSYLDLTEQSETQGGSAKANPAADTVRATLARVLDLTAGEAQVLLVGDVGLASVR